MKKLLVSNLVSVDGYFAGPHGEIDWHNVDDEFNVFAAEMLDTVDTLIFGRLTYELMVNYWPTPNAAKDDPIIATKMNSLKKVVFSRTTSDTTWNNTHFATAELSEEIQRLKQESGKSMVILGSGTLVSQLTKLQLIDEYLLMINPILLGEGKPLFRDIDGRKNLKLRETRNFRSGNVLVKYGI